MLFFDTIANERLVQQNGRRQGIFSSKIELFYLALNMERIQERTLINKSADNTQVRPNVMRYYSSY